MKRRRVIFILVALIVSAVAMLPCTAQGDTTYSLGTLIASINHTSATIADIQAAEVTGPQEQVTFVNTATLTSADALHALDNAISRNAGEIAVLQEVMAGAPVQSSCEVLAKACSSTVGALGMAETDGYLTSDLYVAGIIAPNRSLTVFYRDGGALLW